MEVDEEPNRADEGPTKKVDDERMKMGMVGGKGKGKRLKSKKKKDDETEFRFNQKRIKPEATFFAERQLRERKKVKYFSTEILDSVSKVRLDKKVSSAVTALEESPKPKLGTGRPGVNWDDFLTVPENLEFVAGVELFKWAPLADIWRDFAKNRVGQKIEMVNPFIKCLKRVYWVATVVHFTGYKALVEFERFGMAPKHATWMSYCSEIPKPFGHSVRNGILLYPMEDVYNHYPNFLEKLQDCTKNADTINGDHGMFIKEKIKDCQRFPLKTKLEVLDRSCLSRMRVAAVESVIGDRIHVTYVVEPMPNDGGFWFSVHSDSVHPLGWSAEVGHDIYGKEADDPSDLVAGDLPAFPESVQLAEGQVLEARHPKLVYKICTATVHSVLKHGYFMAEFKTTRQESRKPLLYCFHVTSPYIYPSGFCAKYGIKLGEAFRSSKDPKPKADIHLSLVAPLHLLPPHPRHSFKQSMKLEALDVVNPIYIGPATIIKVAGHMLLLHYDGWNREVEENVAWMDSCSPDIFPLGYCELVGHKFESLPDPPNPLDLQVKFTMAEKLEYDARLAEEALMEKQIWENSIVRGIEIGDRPADPGSPSPSESSVSSSSSENSEGTSASSCNTSILSPI